MRVTCVKTPSPRHATALGDTKPCALLLVIFCFCGSAEQHGRVIMYVQVRSLATGKSVKITTSRTTLVKDLKHLVEKGLGVKPDSQRLIFCGKQVKYAFFLYSFIIRLSTRAVLASSTTITVP